MKEFYIFLIPAVLLAAGCLQQSQPHACPQDAKLCPDGSSVDRVPPKCDFATCPNPGNTTEPGKHYCSPEQREGEVCAEIYQPVCAWFDPAKVQCIKYPCAVTESNSCFACKKSDVLYWTDGTCPK